MTWRWDTLPTEAEMLPSQFGPKQIKLFLQTMSKSILPDCSLAKGNIFIDESGAVKACGKYSIQQDCNGKWMLDDGPNRTTFSSPFNLFSSLLKKEMDTMIHHWELQNYHCGG